jgi:hypothetical protein
MVVSEKECFVSKKDCPTCYTYKNQWRKGIIPCPHCRSGCSKCNNSGLIRCPNCNGSGQVDS